MYYDYKSVIEDEMNKSFVNFFRSRPSSATTHLEIAEYYIKQQLLMSYDDELEEYLSDSYARLTHYNFLMANKALKKEDYKSALIFFGKAKKYCLNNNFKFKNQVFNIKKETPKYNEKYFEENIEFCLEKLKDEAMKNSDIAIWLSEQFEYGDYLEKNLSNALFYYKFAILTKNQHATVEHLNYLAEWQKREFDYLMTITKQMRKEEKQAKKLELSKIKNNKNSRTNDIKKIQNIKKINKLWDNNNVSLPPLIIKCY